MANMQVFGREVVAYFMELSRDSTYETEMYYDLFQGSWSPARISEKLTLRIHFYNITVTPTNSPLPEPDGSAPLIPKSGNVLKPVSSTAHPRNVFQ
jgi:hypothetical protein